MRKRLRKKLHLREFQELGFEVKFKINPDLSIQDRNDLLDRFIEEAIEANGLMFGGGGLNEWDGMAALCAHGSTTSEHQLLVETWLNNEFNVFSYQIGELFDLHKNS
jgi:uncharacterized protein YggL (DUF469 family)